MFIPHSNARLTNVRTELPVHDSFDVVAEPSPRWTGNSDCYVAPPETTLDASSGGRDEITRRAVVIPAVTDIQIGDVIEGSYDGSTFSWKVSEISKRGVGAMPFPFFKLAVEVK